MGEKMQCSKCDVRVCTVDSSGMHIQGEAPSWCPMKTKADVIKRAIAISIIASSLERNR